MAAAASLVSIQKFGGSSTENWTDFESLFRSLNDVANINADRSVDYLKLQLQDAALQFFHTLDDRTRNDLELTLTALKDHFCNPNLKEIRPINLENLKFNNKTDSPEEFVVKLQNLALKAYPPPVDLPVEPLNEEVENDQQRVDRETEQMRVGEILRQWKEIDTSLDYSRKQCQILSDLNSWKNQKTPQSKIYARMQDKN